MVSFSEFFSALSSSVYSPTLMAKNKRLLHRNEWSTADLYQRVLASFSPNWAGKCPRGRFWMEVPWDRKSGVTCERDGKGRASIDP